MRPTGMMNCARRAAPSDAGGPHEVKQMEERIVKFISALRSGGVRVSLAESADAFVPLIENLGVARSRYFSPQSEGNFGQGCGESAHLRGALPALLWQRRTASV